MVRKHQTARRLAQPSPSVLKYLGPVWDPGAVGNLDMITANLVYNTTLTSSAGGIISQSFDQTMTGLAGWAYIGAAYDEFRVLAMQLEFYPFNRYSKTTTVCTPGVGVVDRDSNAALTSLAQGFGYASCRILTLEDPWADRRTYKGNCEPPLVFKMDGVNDSSWITTATPTPSVKPNLKVYFTGLTPSTSYGMAVQRVLVQFRGKVL